LPLPPALDSPEARDQLRKFVLAQLDLERQEQRQRWEQQRTEREQQRRDRMAKDLGLSPSETEKFNQLMTQTQNARAALRDRIESGQLPRENIGAELAAMREDNQKQMRSLLGDDRMKKFEDMRGGGGGPGGPGGPGGGDAGRRPGAGAGAGEGASTPREAARPAPRRRPEPATCGSEVYSPRQQDDSGAGLPPATARSSSVWATTSRTSGCARPP
jgi:hypothetical protein